MHILDKFKDVGTVVMGKIESGSVREGDSLLVMPNKVQVKVIYVHCDENKVRGAGPGENVRIKLSGIEEGDILYGFVLSRVEKHVGVVSEFDAQLQIIELLDNAIFTCLIIKRLHIHSLLRSVRLLSATESR
ncbi:hypothetical protein Scep_020810 [Stephania cephalantha]|uniref:Translation elongation factor EFTu-like domain-containing protein n=1 Tax=Stephania cephalantha TaxID=152367 RepID=A0AAP0I0X5_9MAGN